MTYSYEGKPAVKWCVRVACFVVAAALALLIGTHTQPKATLPEFLTLTVSIFACFFFPLEFKFGSLRF